MSTTALSFEHVQSLWAGLLERAAEAGVAEHYVVYFIILSVALFVWSVHRRGEGAVYLLDFACYKPPQALQITNNFLIWGSNKYGLAEGFTKESVEFQAKISHKNGLSDYTYAASGAHTEPKSLTMEISREESELCLFGAVRELLQRTGLKPRDIDFLVVNCSLFNPTPSLSAMVVNQFKMRSDIITYNLAGMGCSAGIISIDLANRLLKQSPNKNCLVLSTENITQNWYTGNERSMLIPNTLFRIGAAAILLTNKKREKPRCKYELEHVVRVHMGADNAAYRCVYQEEDKDGKVGVTLNKDLVKVAARALEKNLTILGRLALPASEKAKFVADLLLRRSGLRRGKPYQPDFRKAFQHFCLHAGGRGVIEGLGGQMSLSRKQLEPSFSSLYWYGNTSSASYWYGFGFAESKHGMERGDRVWQVGFGSGFKTNSAVWKALKTFRDDRHKAWAHIGPQETAAMWTELESAGVKFENDIMLPQDKKAKRAGSSLAGENGKREEKKAFLASEREFK